VLLHAWVQVDVPSSSALNREIIQIQSVSTEYARDFGGKFGFYDASWPDPDNSIRDFEWFAFDTDLTGAEVSSDTRLIYAATLIAAADVQASHFTIEGGPIAQTWSQFHALTDEQKWLLAV